MLIAMPFKSILETFKKEMPIIADYINRKIRQDDGYYSEYTFFSYLLRYYIKVFRKNKSKEIKSISDFIEKMLIYGDSEVQNLAATGFLETLYIAEDDFDRIRKSFGKKSIEYIDTLYWSPINKF